MNSRLELEALIDELETMADLGHLTDEAEARFGEWVYLIHERITDETIPALIAEAKAFHKETRE